MCGEAECETLVVIPSRLEEAPSTVWSLGTVSSRPWRAALGRNALAPANMGRRAQKRQIWGRCRVSWVHRASTQWWPFLWCHLRSNRPSRASSTSPRTWGVATRPKRRVILMQNKHKINPVQTDVSSRAAAVQMSSNKHAHFTFVDTEIE